MYLSNLPNRKPSHHETHANARWTHQQPGTSIEENTKAFTLRMLQSFRLNLSRSESA